MRSEDMTPVRRGRFRTSSGFEAMRITVGFIIGLLCSHFIGMTSAWGAESLVIASSPSVKSAVEALGRAYEARHPEVRVLVYVDNGLDLRRAIATMENRGAYFIGSGPIHLIAPGGDELIARLEQKYYVLPGTSTTYGEARLVLIVPEALVEAPESFEALASRSLRIAVADPTLTVLGRLTQAFLKATGLEESLKGRLDVGSDARGVLDHVLSGQADAGIVLGPEAYEERERIRVVAVAGEVGYTAPVHSMAMERFCPDRKLCIDFLAFLRTPEAQQALKQVGYVPPSVK
jgi:molybdate transport system substrate-binding protein